MFMNTCMTFDMNGLGPCMDQVTLVDGAVVRFLIACEAEGIELLHGSPYIREWMDGERAQQSSENHKGAKP